MDATMTDTPRGAAPARMGRPRTEVNEIRDTVPEIGTPVWAKRLAVGLGWFSIGLGLAEVAATGPLTRWLGVEEHANLVRAFGLREIATGAAILGGSKIAPFLWGRVAGDALDLAALGTAMAGDARKREVAYAIGAVAGVTVLDILAGKRLGETYS